jgi:hypothetical protein
MQLREDEKKETQTLTALPLNNDRNDPFVYFANVIRDKITMNKYDLSSPATNDIVVKILDASKHAAKTGKTVAWNEYFKK